MRFAIILYIINRRKDVDIVFECCTVDADEGRSVSRKSCPSGSSSGLILENIAAVLISRDKQQEMLSLSLMLSVAGCDGQALVPGDSV
jgi:hypothetical protein